MTTTSANDRTQKREAVLGLKRLRKATGRTPEHRCDNCGCNRYSPCGCSKGGTKRRK